MSRALDAYLDIETTGLSFFRDVITVVGIYLCSATDSKLIQLIGNQVTRDNLNEALSGVHSIFTYNGRRFDLPFIDSSIGLDLSSSFYHRDLMYDCWRFNLKGGFKSVERQLKIPRQLKDVDGFTAVLLWKEYKSYGSKKALDLLLQYNKEDVVNLKALREKLDEFHLAYHSL